MNIIIPSLVSGEDIITSVDTYIKSKAFLYLTAVALSE
jgi:hypothetical protein